MYYNKKSNMPDGRKGVPMKLVIPEYKTLELDTIFLDMNGTIAVDGVIPPSVKERLIALSEQFRIYVLTADTHGNAKAQCEGLPVILETFPTGNAKEYKRELVKFIPFYAYLGIEYKQNALLNSLIDNLKKEVDIYNSEK